MRTFRTSGCIGLALGALILTSAPSAAVPTPLASRSAVPWGLSPVEQWGKTGIFDRIEGRTDRASLARAHLEDALARAAAYLPEDFGQALRSGHTSRVIITTAVGDLNSDGRSELAVSDYSISFDAIGGVMGTLTLKIHSGTNGRELWRDRFDFVDGFAFPIPMRLGPKGARSLLVVNQRFPFSSTTWQLTLSALSGKGSQMWEREFVGEAAGAGPIATAEGIPILVGPIHALEGKASDLLVGVIDQFFAQETVTNLEVVLVDGSTGGSPGTTPPVATTGDYEPVPHIGPDLDGDGLDDYLVTIPDTSTTGRIEAHRGVDGLQLWAQEALPMLGFPLVSDVGNTTDDEVPDLALSSGFQSTESLKDVPLVLLEGGTGEPLWTKRGYFSYPLKDVNRDGRWDVGTVTEYLGPKTAGVKYVGYDSSGKKLFTRKHALPYDSGDPDSALVTFYIAAGHFDHDRVEDLFVYQILQQSSGAKAQTFVGIGRNGKARFKNKPILPLGGSVDRKGDDVIHLSLSPTLSFRLSVRDIGGAERMLWDLLSHDLGLTNLVPVAAHLNSDKCDDVVLALYEDEFPTLVALDGASGKKLWSREIVKGKGPNFTLSRVRDRNSSC